MNCAVCGQPANGGIRCDYVACNHLSRQKKAQGIGVQHVRTQHIFENPVPLTICLCSECTAAGEKKLRKIAACVCAAGLAAGIPAIMWLRHMAMNATGDLEAIFGLAIIPAVAVFGAMVGLPALFLAKGMPPEKFLERYAKCEMTKAGRDTLFTRTAWFSPKTWGGSGVEDLPPWLAQQLKFPDER